MKFNKTVIAVAVTALMLQACGGGGGGGAFNPNPGSSSSSSSSSNSSSNTVASTATYNVAAPVLVSIINPLVAASTYGSALNIYTADLAGNGSENVLIAGDINGAPSNSRVNSKITIFGWNNGQLVDQTSQWFSGTDNIITGTARLSFGNFNGNGRMNFYTATGTDGQASSNTAQIFINNGSNFTRYDVALPYALDTQDNAVFRYNGVDNIVSVAYPYTEVIMGSTSNNFRAYAVGSTSGVSVASGNFLGTGQPSFVIGQYGSSTCLGCQPDALVGFNFDGTTVTMPFIRNMPTPMFNTAGYFTQTGGSNTIKVMKMDFDESGVDSVFILAMPNNWQTSPYQSSIQFLKNNGSGVFTDVTATTVTGYDMTKSASTNPVIIDLLNTGLPDIVLPTPGGTQVLMQVSRGQYVASMANTITNFQSQVQALITQNSTTNGQTSQYAQFTFVRGPNNELYMLDLVPMGIGGVSQNAVYLSRITGSTVQLNGQQAITAARTAWPWLTDTQLQTMITATGMSLYGVPIIDPEALLNPSGSLTVYNQPIRGYIGGINLGTDFQLSAMDQLGRNFTVNMAPTQLMSWRNGLNMDSEHIDQYELTSHTEYLISGYVNTVNGLRFGSETRNQFNAVNMSDPSVGPTLNNPVNFTVGVPRAWSSGNWSGGVQYTWLNYNPWIAFNGSWGLVNQSANFDTTIRYTKDGFTAVGGITHTTTQITPGLVTKVNDIVGVWGEVGYRYNDFGVYLGVKPVPIIGSVEATIPTSVDSRGNINYTNRTLGLTQHTTEYIRALWSTDLNKNTKYKVSGTVMTNGQVRVMNEVRIAF